MTAEKPALTERRYSTKQEVDFANMEASDGHCGLPRRMRLLIAGTVVGGLCDQGGVAGACPSAAEEGWTSWQNLHDLEISNDEGRCRQRCTSKPREEPDDNQPTDDQAGFEPRSANHSIRQFHPALLSRRSEEHTSELQSPYDLVCR